MVSHRDHLAAVKAEINEVTAQEAAELLSGANPPALVDVRERDEYEQGFIPGAVFIPRGNLESRIEAAVPDHDQPVVIYCASGNRSAYAAKTLTEMGYTHAVSMSGGFSGWKQAGRDWRSRAP